MLTAFWSGLGGELAKHWAARILTPAFAFWTGGLATVWWAAHRDDVHAQGWSSALRATGDTVWELPAFGQGVVLVGALFLVAVSALIAERLTLPLLRLLEGYWTRPAFLRRWLVTRRREFRQRWSRRVEALRVLESRGDLSLAEYTEFHELDGREAMEEDERARLAKLAERAGQFTAEEAAELARGVLVLRTMPRNDRLGMPTRLGDILRAAERRPVDKYGLDAVVCWYRLWTVMPTDTRSQIVEVRLALDSALRTCLWGALFLVWIPWLWWIALPIGILVPLAVYRFSMLPAAALFGDLVETAFDVHRMQLYDAMHLPRPASAAVERRHGQQLTALLWHGETDPSIVYLSPPS